MDADQIEKIAKDANDTSTKAYNLLVKTLEGEGKTGQEIDELNKKYVFRDEDEGVCWIGFGPAYLALVLQVWFWSCWSGFLIFSPGLFPRYNQAKELAKTLEKEANKVKAEAEEAGNKALEIFANLTSLPPFDAKALEVTSTVWTCQHAVLSVFLDC